MTFLDNLSEHFSLEDISSNSSVNNRVLNPSDFIRMLRFKLLTQVDYSNNLFSEQIPEESLDSMIEYFRESIQTSPDVRLYRIFNTISNENNTSSGSSSTSLSIFNTFKDLDRNYSRFFTSVNTIRLSRYV